MSSEIDFGEIKKYNFTYFVIDNILLGSVYYANNAEFDWNYAAA